jgi:hypothetical protein
MWGTLPHILTSVLVVSWSEILPIFVTTQEGGEGPQGWCEGEGCGGRGRTGVSPHGKGVEWGEKPLSLRGVRFTVIVALPHF